MAPSARIELQAHSLDLGRHLQSWRWSKYHYILIAAFTGAITIGYVPPWFQLLRDSGEIMTRNGFGTQVLMVGIVALVTIFLATFIGITWHLLWGAIAGTGRSLHLYERGLIVARPWSMRAWRFRDLASIDVERSSTPTTGSFNVSVTLTGLDGRKLVMDKRKAIGAVSSAAKWESGANPKTADLPSGGPDFPAHYDSPDTGAAGD